MSSQPFDKIRVVEFGQYIAAPYCGQLLAEGGAHVIKIEAPGGESTRQTDPIVPNESFTFISPNRGKHSLPLKLNDPAARPVIDALLRSADVVLMNFRPGLAAKLGLSAEDIVRNHPGIIVGDITPFGKRGPDAELAGMDVVVQSRSGLMAAIGRIDDDRPAPGNAIVSDYMGAMSLAFGVASALFRRAQTGKGGIVDVTLMQAAMTLSAGHYLRSEDRDNERHKALIKEIHQGQANGMPFRDQIEMTGISSRTRLRRVYFRSYTTASAPISISCVPRQLQARFMEVVGIEDKGLTDAQAKLPEDYYVGLQRQVEEVVNTRPSDDWIKALSEVGVPVAPVKIPVEIFEDEQAIANDMFYILDHPTAGRLKAMSPTIKLDGGGFRPLAATPTFASETASLLTQLGFSSDEIDALVAAGVTSRAN